MTDSASPVVSPADQKRRLRRRLWLIFGGSVLLVVVIGVLVALLGQAGVGVVNQVTTMVVCFLPALIVLLLLWVAIASAIFFVSRLEVNVTRQLASLEGQAHDAKLRAQTAGLTLGRAAIRLVNRTEKLERWLSTFDETPADKDASDE